MRYLAGVIAALSLCLFAAPAAGARVRTEFFGIAAGQLDVQDRQGMAAARVQTARFMLKWRDIEKSPGSYDWSDRDWFIGGLASQGIRSVPFVWGSPKWVGNGAPGTPPLATAAEIQSWRNFLKAAASRYGPGGTYWAPGGKYDQDYGTSATPLPVKSWQVWNEPNLKKYFSPGSTIQQVTQKYARLLTISHDTITATNPGATIVLAGMPSFGDVTAWKFLNYLYNVTGVQGDFDVAALHPYGCDLERTEDAITRFRTAMKSHGDGPTPLWLTEFAWGSGPPDQFCKNKGETGQRSLLVSSFRMILKNRKPWNVQRVFWFLWRDPRPGSYYAKLCSICGSAGLMRNDRTPKPAYTAFKSFTAETTPPVASIPGGPKPGSRTNDPTPTFFFGSNEAGSTFVCHFGTAPFKPCGSPLIPAVRLSDGPHTFYVKAIDAPGNESAVVSRSFTVDTQPPPAPQITDTDPNSPANHNVPRVKGVAPAGTTVRLYKTAGCAGAPVVTGTAAQFASPGLGVSVPDNSTTVFRASTRDAAGNISPCSEARAYVEDSTPPQTTITGGPPDSSTDDTPTFTFSSTESGSAFKCRFDSDPFAACSGPGASHTPSAPLSIGTHTFEVQATDRAKNTDPTPAIRTFTVDF
ncbi:MAG TPA: glycosyl hydrolase [Solirubrobacterales bacterium]|nr:glycosyl hydrolase [Solirubrobacterales bacterium]